MNFYMLVEGKSAEMKIYPKLISIYRPQYRRAKSLEDIGENSYYMFSGMGIPSLYDKIGPSIQDIQEFNETHPQNIDRLVVCLDTDYYGNEESTHFRITQELMKRGGLGIDFTVILQTMCIESWFLGNREAYPKIAGQDFLPYSKHYDVSQNDPEKMEPPDDKITIGSYAKQYLKKMLNESGRTYSVRQVKDVTTEDYIRGMDARLRETGHIHSFGYFKDFLEEL